MKDVNSIKGIHSIKTSRITPQKSSIPMTRSSRYLKCYMIYTEKERLLKECEQHRMKIGGIEKKIEYINKRTEKIDKDLESLVKDKNFHSAAETAYSEPLLSQDNKEKGEKFSLHY